MGSSCSGAIELSGMTWASTSSTITFTIPANPACSGTISCQTTSSPTVIDCSKFANPSASTGSCDYALSNDDHTLTLSKCVPSSPGNGGSTVTFTRQ
jgi:hypothetical protein